MVVILYTARSCTSSRKAREWLQEAHIPFEERLLEPGALTKAEVQRLLRFTEKGTEELLSTRSKAYPDVKRRMEHMTTNELVTLLVETPSLLRHPILIDDLRMQVGFHEDQIRRFLPRTVRALALQQAQLLAGF